MATYMCAILMITLPVAIDPVRSDIFAGFLMMIFLVTFILPAINIVLFKIFGTVSSLAMEDRRDRIVPFSFISLLYLLMTYLFYVKFKIALTDNIMKLLIIMDALVIAATLVTLFYKVSVHSMGICGLLGILIPLNKVSEDGRLLYPTIAVIVIAGVVLSSRLQLNAHTSREVMVGGMLGFAIGFGGMMALF